MISISNYAMLALLDMSAMALVPLVWSTPIEMGGLNFSPASIGLWLSGYGFLNGIIQFFFFPRVVGRLGPGRVVLTSVAGFVIIYSMFPLENLAARYAVRGGGTNAAVWPLVMFHLASICVTDMGFSEYSVALLRLRPSCTLPLTLCSSPPPKKTKRFGVHVSCRGGPEQTLARCYEWPRADRGRNPAHGRPGRCCIAFCVLSGERRPGWELCIRHAPRRRLCRSMRLFAAPEVHMEA
jgi:hypothetical protein